MTPWFAPGRINLIGEHTDYNDGFVLPFALGVGCTTVVSPGSDGWSVRSAQEPEPIVVRRSGLADARPRSRSGRATSSVPSGCSPTAALTCPRSRSWWTPTCRPERACRPRRPSSARSCGAVDDHLGLGLDDDAIFALTRDVENDAVGAPTGGMDQLVSLRGRAGHALLCDMRTHETRPVPLDLAGAGLAVLVADTRAPHQHSDGEYGARRRGCEEAARLLGVPALRDVAEDDLDRALERLDDDELRRYVRHVVTENARVLEVARLLDAGRLPEIGPALTASHASMRDDFQITVPEVDTAVEALLSAGALGARMTGGGFGGCVIGLVPAREVAPAGDGVRRAFADAGFSEPTLFTATPEAGARPVGFPG